MLRTSSFQAAFSASASDLELKAFTNANAPKESFTKSL
jgi:hypothetical protein